MKSQELERIEILSQNKGYICQSSTNMNLNEKSKDNSNADN